MAWGCSSSTNRGLVSNLKRAGLLSTQIVTSAFFAVDRGYFAPSNPYSDAPQSIGWGATISAPHMHAMCTEALCDRLTRPDARILDIGSGTGILLAYWANMKGDGGRLVGVEHVPELAEKSKDSLRLALSDALFKGVEVISGDGRARALAAQNLEGPWDVIHVGAATSSEEAAALAALLSPAGALLAPVDDLAHEGQELTLFTRAADGRTFNGLRITSCRYVALCDRADCH